MPALPPYIPARDAAFANWLTNFSTLITAAPGTYGLTAPDAVNIATVTSVWTAAYSLVTSPATKTADTVTSKNNAKFGALAVVRPYAQTISLNAGVTSANKIAVGVNPRSSTPQPITAPTSNPVLTVQYAGNLASAIRYRDSAASPSVKSKPYGVTRLQLSYDVSATAIVDPTLLTRTANATKSPFLLAFGSGDVGKQAYMAARWVTRTGGYSPWSPIINFTVAAGM